MRVAAFAAPLAASTAQARLLGDASRQGRIVSFLRDQSSLRFRPVRAFTLLIGLPLAACVSWDTPANAAHKRLKRYKAEHYEAIPQQPSGVAGAAELSRRLGSTRVLVFGDEHTDRRLHRRLHNWLQRLAHGNAHVTLLAEFLGSDDRPTISDYMEGRIDLVELRRRVRARWPASWMELQHFDGGFYRGLLALARTSRCAVVPLEPVPRLSLKARDAAMAHSIQQAAERRPSSLVIVVVGHAHLLGQGHLLDRLQQRGIDALAVLPRAPEAMRGLATLDPAAPFLVLGPRLWAFRPNDVAAAGSD